MNKYVFWKYQDQKLLIVGSTVLLLLCLLENLHINTYIYINIYIHKKSEYKHPLCGSKMLAG